MAKILSGMKVAALVANGFCQKDFVASQRAMIEAGANLRVVSSEQGLVNGWQDDSWGHHFAVDTQINMALAADFDALIMPGGQKSCDKLRLTAHTRRFINGFLSAGKPVFMMNEATGMLAAIDCAQGRTVCCPENMMEMMSTAGAIVEEKSMMMDNNLATCMVSDENRSECMKMLCDLFMECDSSHSEAQAA